MWNLWKRFKAYYFLSEEEMGKKDDDHIPAHIGPRPRPNSGHWAPARGPSRRTAKKVLVWCLGVAVLYFLFRSLPSDFDFQDYRPHLVYPEAPHEADSVSPPEPPPAAVDKPSPQSGRTAASSSEHKYNGPVKFHNLAASLHAISDTRGGMLQNKNVLFAASNLKSAAALLPLACQMGRDLRSYVHFALMSRSDIELQELREINGIDEDCEIIFHGMWWQTPVNFVFFADSV
jgi:hypothetical protein